MIVKVKDLMKQIITLLNIDISADSVGSDIGRELSTIKNHTEFIKYIKKRIVSDEFNKEYQYLNGYQKAIKMIDEFRRKELELLFYEDKKEELEALETYYMSIHEDVKKYPGYFYRLANDEYEIVQDEEFEESLNPITREAIRKQSRVCKRLKSFFELYLDYSSLSYVKDEALRRLKDNYIRENDNFYELEFRLKEPKHSVGLSTNRVLRLVDKALSV